MGNKKVSEIRILAKQIWDYMHLGHELKNVDCILVLGSHDTRVAVRGAELYLQKLAPLIIFSGGLGKITSKKQQQSEAEAFAKIAKKMGVPKEKILIENKSTNTGENILFTKRLLEEKQIYPKNIILVTKPYMERRSYATFMKQWGGDVEILVTSPQLTFEEYFSKNQSQSFDDFVNIMAGDLQRIKIYPKKGFQISQNIPSDVWQAYERLVEFGYDKYVIK